MCFRFSTAHLNTSVQYPFNRSQYNEYLFTRLVPICSNTLLQTQTEANNQQNDVDMTCSDFLPSFTNNGLCLTRNGASLNQIFISNSHLRAFQTIFHPKHYNPSVKKIETDHSGYHFTFVLDANTYKDLKRGLDWNSSSNTVFTLGIHSPNDTADIRGWYQKIVTVSPGYITRINIKPSQLTSDESIRGLDMKTRKCNFPDENSELSSMKWYSKVNCLLDCNMEFAESICGCRPWDYPTSDQINKTLISHQLRICDFYGNTCFNGALRKITPQCNSKCISNCEEVNYSMYIVKEPIDPKNRICSYLKEPITTMDIQIKKYIRSLFSENNWYDDADDVSDSPPERRIMNLIKDILLKANESYYAEEKHAFERDCAAKLESDIAAVIVSIDSPKFSRMIKSVKASTFDKMANLGKFDIDSKDNYST